MLLWPTLTIDWFQFALPRGERLFRIFIFFVFGKFQFALPRGERLELAGRGDLVVGFQFALPRGERRQPPKIKQ